MGYQILNGGNNHYQFRTKFDTVYSITLADISDNPIEDQDTLEKGMFFVILEVMGDSNPPVRGLLYPQIKETVIEFIRSKVDEGKILIFHSDDSYERADKRSLKFSVWIKEGLNENSAADIFKIQNSQTGETEATVGYVVNTTFHDPFEIEEYLLRLYGKGQD